MGEFLNNEGGKRFEWAEEGGVTFADYRIEPNGAYAIRHVETPEALRGHGAAKKLMDAIVADARAKTYKLRALCPYAVAYFQRYPETRDVED